MQRHRSRVECYAHFVWTTKGRQALLTPEWEETIHQSILAEAKRLRCEAIAIGGLADHVHLLVRMPASLSISTLAKQVKGTSSSVYNNRLPEFEERFRWQDGYGCFSIGRSQVSWVIAYIRNQKQLHITDRIWPEWEVTGELVNTSPDTDM